MFEPAAKNQAPTITNWKNIVDLKTLRYRFQRTMYKTFTGDIIIYEYGKGAMNIINFYNWKTFD